MNKPGAKKTVVLLPTDNRPITYIFPQQICQLAGLNVLVPPRNLMGSLFAPTNSEELRQWLETAVSQIESGAILICIDSLLYGGLIPSRRGKENLEAILERAAQIVSLKQEAGDSIKIYVQSSIMRISDNYDNTEEKLYWSKYGREIFNWSQLLHRQEIGLLKSEQELENAEKLIDKNTRDDYLGTRERNFRVNQKIIDYVKSGDIDFLIFSQDDSGHYGLNVSEKNKLIAVAQAKNIQNVLAYPGADEMLMTLIARYLNEERRQATTIALHYSAYNGKEIASNYEGQNIGDSMEHQSKAQGYKIVEADIKDKVDFHVIVHTGTDIQGDHVWLPGLKDLRKVDSEKSVQRAIQLIEQADCPVVICDLAYSNGADSVLIDLLLERPQLFSKIWAYGGWNTTGNAIGSALAAGAACLYAKANNGLDDLIRKKLLFIRLMDDWAYQTQVRREMQPDKINTEQEQAKLSKLMDACANKLATALRFHPGPIQYGSPWRRTFEIEINLYSQIATTMP